MDMHVETKDAAKLMVSKNCHCSVCFKEINNVEAATHSLAGRYYCEQCRTTFRGGSLKHSAKPSA